MGASQGKSKKELKDEAREWAQTKEIEVATLYGEHSKLLNEFRLLQADFQEMKRMMEQEFKQSQVQQMNADDELKQQKSEMEAVKQAFETFKQNMFDDAGDYCWIGSRPPPGLGDHFASRIAHRFMPPSQGILKHEKDFEKYRKERLSNTGLFG
jgi:hypothetical protein